MKLVSIYRIATKIAKTSSQFDMEEFKKLDSLEEIWDYANSNLELAGKIGSSRGAFVHGNDVIKIARPDRSDRGVSQNKAEVDIFTDPKTKPVCATVKSSDDDYRWIVSERIEPITKSEFKSITGCDWPLFVASSRILEYPDTTIDIVFEELKQYAKPGQTMTVEMMEILQNLMEMHLEAGDLRKLEHWGKTSSGKIALLDYGFTEDVWETYYDV